MLADEATRQRERIVLADEPNGIRKASRTDQRHVPRYVHMRRTTRSARHCIPRSPIAAPRARVGLEVMAKALEGAEHHGSRLIADGTVSARVRSPSRALEHSVDQSAHLGQPYATGHAFPTRLGCAQANECTCELDRADTRRPCRCAPHDRLADFINHPLRRSGLLYLHQCHRPAPPWALGDI